MYHRNHLMCKPNKDPSGIEQHGLGDGPGMIFGMNIAQQLDDRASKPTMTFDEQIEMLTKLKSLLDAGILSRDEFDQRKRNHGFIIRK